MPIAFDAARAALGTFVFSVTTPSWTISGTDRCMVGAVMWHDPIASNFDFDAMRWGGIDLTPFGTSIIAPWNQMGIATARLIAPTVMTSTLYGAVSTDHAGPPVYLFVGAANYTGVNQVTPLGTPATISFSPYPPAVNVPLNPNEWALAWVITSSSTITPDGSQNQRWEIETDYSVSSDDNTGSGSAQLRWTVSGQNPWYHLVRTVPLKPVTVHHLLTAESGSYVIDGQEADLLWQSNAYRLNADSGVYMTRGRAVRLAYSGRYVLRVLRRQH